MSTAIGFTFLLPMKAKELVMDDLSYIEENFRYCTYCNDHKYVNSLAQQPCPYCNKEEYREWKHDEELRLRRNSKGKNQ